MAMAMGEGQSTKPIPNNNNETLLDRYRKNAVLSVMCAIMSFSVILVLIPQLIEHLIRVENKLTESRSMLIQYGELRSQYSKANRHKRQSRPAGTFLYKPSYQNHELPRNSRQNQYDLLAHGPQRQNTRSVVHPAQSGSSLHRVGPAPLGYDIYGLPIRSARQDHNSNNAQNVANRPAHATRQAQYSSSNQANGGGLALQSYQTNVNQPQTFPSAAQPQNGPDQGYNNNGPEFHPASYQATGPELTDNEQSQAAGATDNVDETIGLGQQQAQCCTCNQGPPGPAGNEGDAGLDGVDGLPGEPGADGLVPDTPPPPPPAVCENECSDGPPGPEGCPGLPGPRGELGDEGPEAEPASGEPGPEGPAGDKGPIGDIGDPGPPGDDGQLVESSETSSSGGYGAAAQAPRGPAGDSGPDGPVGEPGGPGTDGREPRDGAPGPRGDVGDEGPKGLQGTDGYQGRLGVTGLDGECNHCPFTRVPPGYKGAQGVPQTPPQRPRPQPAPQRPPRPRPQPAQQQGNNNNYQPATRPRTNTNRAGALVPIIPVNSPAAQRNRG